MADIFDQLDSTAGGDIFDEITAPTPEPAPQAPELMVSHGAASQPEPDLGTVAGRFQALSESGRQPGELVGAVGSGMYGRALGAMQAQSELLSKLPTGVRNVVAQMTPASGLANLIPPEVLRQKEAERRQVMEGVKAQYGEKGVTNPASVAEFAGEVAPELVGGGAAFEAQLASKLPATIGRYAKSVLGGAAGGAASGATQPLTEEESRAQNVALGAAGGAVLAPVATLAAEAAPKIGRFAADRAFNWLERKAIREAVPEARKYVSSEAGQIIEAGLRKAAPRQIKAGASPTEIGRMVVNDHEGLNTLVNMKDDFKFWRGERQVVGVPRTVDEAVQATEQGIAKLSDEISALQAQAGEQGTAVPLKELVDGLTEIASDIQGRPPELRAAAQKYLDDFTEVNNLGDLPIDKAIMRMSAYNAKLNNWYKGAGAAGEPIEVTAYVANNLRKALNDTMEQATGSPAFAQARRKMGQLLGLQERLLRTQEAELNKAARGGMRTMDIISLEQVIHGKIPQALASQLVSKTERLMRSPDRAIARAFRAAEAQAEQQAKKQGRY